MISPCQTLLLAPLLTEESSIQAGAENQALIPGANRVSIYRQYSPPSCDCLSPNAPMESSIAVPQWRDISYCKKFPLFPIVASGVGPRRPGPVSATPPTGSPASEEDEEDNQTHLMVDQQPSEISIPMGPFDPVFPRDNPVPMHGRYTGTSPILRTLRSLQLTREISTTYWTQLVRLE